MLLAAAATAQSTIPGSGGVPKSDKVGLSPTTESALRAAASSNLFEIESSRLALTRSQSGRIKEFADRMLADHARAATKAKQVLGELGATLPPAGLDARHQQRLDALKAAPNADFDKAYVEAQVEAHAEAIKLMTDYARYGDNPRLKALAAELLPTLQNHLDHARQLH